MPDALRAVQPDRDRVLSFEVLANAELDEAKPSTQRVTLVRHFLERFFNNETTAADGDGKTRLVQVACAIGIPPLVLTLYLYPAYHPPFHRLRPWRAQVGDHYFYIVYSLVAMAVLTIFQWDLLFPDLLDVFILSMLPVRLTQLFRARVCAIGLLLGAALFDANVLAIIVLPAATDPPHLFRLLGAQAAAVCMSGWCGAAFFLALEGSLLAILGDRIFRRIALWLQGAFVMALLATLFAWSAVASTLQGLLAAPNRFALAFPPFWFLGVYQRIFDGPATRPIFIRLAHIGIAATVVVTAAALASYPIAWWRRTTGLIEGAVRKNRQNAAAIPARGLLHATLARTPTGRAVWHFINQNLVRVPRYRMVLVLYGGAGAALLFAAVVRLHIAPSPIRLVFSPAGLRAAVPIIAFWTIAGLRSTFLAPADQRGRWIFRIALGKPGLPQLAAAQRWVLSWSLLLTLAAAAWTSVKHPAAHHHPQFIAAQIVVALALSILLTDAFFFNVRTIPFTGAKSSSATNFALLLIPYLGFFPAIVLFTVGLEPVIEASYTHIATAAAIACAAHGLLAFLRCARLAEHLQLIDPDDDEEEFPQRLGLRY